MIVQVAVNNKSAATDKLYDYSVDDAEAEDIRVGMRVTVPFGNGNRILDGYILGIKPSLSRHAVLKSVISVSGERVFDEKTLVLIHRMREKYLSCYYDIIRAITPAAFRTVSAKTIKMARLAVSDEVAERFIENSAARQQVRVAELLLYNGFAAVKDIKEFIGCGDSVIKKMEKDGIIEFFKYELSRDPYKDAVTEKSIFPPLTDEQESCLERIYSAMDEGRYEEFLLHGVTGSGKTEVFLNAIQKARAAGKQAVMLVPEISLTPQTVKRFLSRFGNDVAVYHSGLSMGEKFDEWKKMMNGEKNIVVGARSAVFAPFSDIGVIIIDEAHSEGYKSGLSPRYDAKEVAQMRGKLFNAPVIYASATPLVADYKKALDKKITLLEIKKRFNQKPLPPVYVADMRRELELGNRSIFSRKLLEEIELNLKKKQQTILFLNRRGFSTFVSCRECGFSAKCPNCSITLTYHRAGEKLKCHYCGYERANYRVCPECGSSYIRYFGGGTQKVEEEIKKIFPECSVMRMDIDTVSGKMGHEKLLKRFEEERPDILIGTQMVAKGLDFAGVTLVGVISADTMLNIDDYRSAERTFSLLEQVTGRAGRGDAGGRAVIQTYTPEHSAIVNSTLHNYRAFYDNEIAIRQAMYYPPFCEITGILCTSHKEEAAKNAAVKFAMELKRAGIESGRVRILGPVSAAVSKIQNKYRWQLMIKAPKADRLNGLLLDIKKECVRGYEPSELTIVIDKNPNSL